MLDPAHFRYSTKTFQAQSAPGDIDHRKSLVGWRFITTNLRWISSVNTAGADRGDPPFATSHVRWYTSGWRVSVSAAIAFVLIAVVVSNVGGLFENTTYLGMRLAPAFQLTVNVKGTLCCSVVVPEVMVPVTVRV